MKIRVIARDEIDAGIGVARACGLFQEEEIEVLRARLQGTLDEGADAASFWMVADRGESGLAGLAYCAPEEMTDRTWNLLFIGVHPDVQGAGVGRALLEGIEERLRSQAQRILLIKTTQAPEQEVARRFYLRNGYREEGRVRDYYADGLDEITFSKRL